MLRLGIILGLLGVFLLGWAGPIQAQEAQQAQAPQVAGADGDAVFQWVQGWVRSEDGVPGQADLPKRPVVGAFGVYVTLRQEGKVLGRGQAIREDVAKAVDQPGPAIELAVLAAAATEQALAELRDKQMKRAVVLRINDPELFQQGLMATRGALQIDVQIGHGLTSIVLPPDAKEDAVFTAFAPGFHGLRMAGPLAAKADYTWPATELSRNTSPPRMLFRLLDEQGYDPDDLALVARAQGPTLQRFEVMHNVRPGPGQPMRRLIRGGIVLQQQVIDGRTIAGLAERTARYLDQLVVTEQQTGDLVVRGTYQPSAQKYHPAWSNPRETALLTYALTRHARIAIDADLAGDTMRARATRMVRLVDRLAPAALPEGGQISHLSAAFLLMTLCETPIQLKPDQLVLRDRLARALVELRHPEGGGFRVAPGNDKRLTRASAAVLTAALASWHERTRSKTLVEPIWAVLADLMNENAKDPRVVDLLWVSHALSRAGAALADAHPRPDEAGRQLSQWKAMLADQLDRISEQQVRGNPVLGPGDVMGGFVLEPAVPGSPPNPTWQSAMPLTVLAFGLRDKDIIDPDRAFGPLLTAGLGARFLGQLMITNPSGYYLRETLPALGGIRARLWDNTLYPDCSSMSLIALAELQHSLDVLDPGEDK